MGAGAAVVSNLLNRSLYKFIHNPIVIYNGLVGNSQQFVSLLSRSPNIYQE